MHLKQKSNCTPFPQEVKSASNLAGFTLFEILIVLALISLIAGLVVGGGAQMYGSIQFALEKSDIEKSLNDLPYQSFTLKKRIVLGNESEPESQIDPQDDLVTSPHLKLPPNWTAYVSYPVIYRSNGYCSGGLIKLKSDNRELNYTLKAPNCVPILEGSS